MDHIMFPKVPIARWINQLWCINLGDVHTYMNVISMCICIFVHPYCFCESMFPKWKISWKQCTVCRAVGTTGAGRSIFPSYFGTAIDAKTVLHIFGSVTEICPYSCCFLHTKRDSGRASIHRINESFPLKPSLVT